MSDEINAKIRDGRGTPRAKKLRAAGLTPAVLYGHGKDTVALSIPTKDIEHAIRTASHAVGLSGDVTEQALIKDVQWDALGSNVLHVDLLRVRKGELVEVTVAIEVRGVAPGLNEGGVVSQSLHELPIECPALKIPESLEVNINELNLHDVITVADLTLPEGASTQVDSDAIVLQCVEPAAERDEDEEGMGGPLEPEVIGGKPDEEEEG